MWLVIEKTAQKAPIVQRNSHDSISRLQSFAAVPDHCLSIIGPRRIPSLECPNQSTHSSIAISTSVGFHNLDVEEYVYAVNALDADITTSILDLVQTQAISQKRKEKSAERTHDWLRDTIAARSSAGAQTAPLFASIPPLEPEQQSFYLGDLGDGLRAQISGLTLFSPDTAVSLPATLQALPRLLLTDPVSPQEILRSISLGVDLMTLPMITTASENGIALSFNFQPESDEEEQILGIDMWSTNHAKDPSPLVPNCSCYTCTRHHRAYVQHLLSAKEMLAWTLLQLHNYHMMDCFFRDVRKSIAQGTFGDDTKRFNRHYTSELPVTSGQGPRIRGYQAKSIGGGEPRRNAKAYGRLDEQAMKLREAESGITTPDVDADDLVSQGLGQKLA